MTEDKTFHTIRIVSEKNACENQGSVVTHGGIYVRKNILCDDEVRTNELVVHGLTKLADDVSIGGILYCPELFYIDDVVLKIRRNLVPGKIQCCTKENEKASLGTIGEPWDEIHAKNIYSDQINTECILSNQLQTLELTAGKNECGGLGISIKPGEINIMDNLNIVNPQSNTVMINISNDCAESFIPINFKWNSFIPTEINYDCSQIYYITSSNIFINIADDCENMICLEFDACKVPNNTKVKIYFTSNGCQLIKVQYRITIIGKCKKYIFGSKNPTKKMKLIFVNENIYLAS